MKKILMIMAVAAGVSLSSCCCDKNDKACNDENCPNKEQCTDCTDCNAACGEAVEATEEEETTTTEPTEGEVAEAQLTEGAAEI